VEAELLCTLRDCRQPQFSDEEGWLPPVPGDISTPGELLDHLRIAATRRPHTLHMELPGRVRVAIFVGGPWGSVEVYHLFVGNRIPSDHPPSWHVLADRPPPVEFVAFWAEGSEATVDVPADCLLSAEDVIRIATHLAVHRTLPRAYTWRTHDFRGTAIHAGRDRPWEDWDKPLDRHRLGAVPF
jgi:hypothetical protein